MAQHLYRCPQIAIDWFGFSCYWYKFFSSLLLITRLCIENMKCIENKLVTWKDYGYHCKKTLPLTSWINASKLPIRLEDVAFGIILLMTLKLPLFWLGNWECKCDCPQGCVTCACTVNWVVSFPRGEDHWLSSQLHPPRNILNFCTNVTPQPWRRTMTHH